MIAMVTGLVVVGALAGSHLDLLEPAVRRACGCSLQTTLDGDLVRLFSSLFLTAGGWRFFASVLMLGIGVSVGLSGITERGIACWFSWAFTPRPCP